MAYKIDLPFARDSITQMINQLVSSKLFDID